jgi:hypothetical protein
MLKFTRSNEVNEIDHSPIDCGPYMNPSEILRGTPRMHKKFNNFINEFPTTTAFCYNIL